MNTAPRAATTVGLETLRLVQPQARFAAALRRDGRVLDVGCGDFARIDRYVGRHRGDLDIVGIDLAHDASIYGPLPPPNPRPGKPYRRLGCDLETEAFPFEDASFDGVYFAHVIEHLHDRTRVLREIARVLRPGGIAYVETPGPVAARVSRPFWIDRKLGGTVRYDDDPTHLGDPMTVRDLASELETAGLVVERTGTVREYGLPGLPVYALMTAVGSLPLMPQGVASFLYGAGVRNLVGWAIYASARRSAGSSSGTYHSANGRQRERGAVA